MLNERFSKIFLTLVILLFVVLRTVGMGENFSNSDAQRWHSRSEKFYESLKSGKFVETYQRYHPGVTLMWLSTVSKVGIKTYSDFFNISYKSIGNVEGYILHDTVSKLLIIFVITVLLVLQYLSIKELSGPKIAQLYVILMALEPYLLGIDRWYHLTSLESYLSMTALLYLLRWRKNPLRKFLITTGLLFGFALLTRFTSVMGLAVSMIIVCYYSVKGNTNINQLALNILYLTLPVIATVFILFPALWVSPAYVFGKILNAGAEAVSGNYESVTIALKYPAIFYLLVLIAKLSPVTLALIIPSLLSALKSKSRESAVVLVYVSTCLFFYTLSDQKIERYVILVIPGILFSVACLLAQLKKPLYLLILTVTLFSTLFFYTHYHPYISFYYSPIVGGAKGAYNLGFLDTNGEYYDAAARYLNSKGRDVRVYVPNNAQSFTPYFKGKMANNLNDRPEFVVFSVDSSRKMEEFSSCRQIEKVYSIDGLEYLWIFKCL